MSSEKIIIYRTNEDSTKVEQYPKTSIDQVYDLDNNKSLKESLLEIENNIGNNDEIQSIKNSVENHTKNVDLQHIKLVNEPITEPKDGVLYVRPIDTSENYQFVGSGASSEAVVELEKRVGTVESSLSKITEIESNLNAHTQQTDWLTATMINGFEGEILYRKDSHNIVHIALKIDKIPTVSPNTIIARLPRGYIPLCSTPMTVLLSNLDPYSALNSINIISDGNICLAYSNGLRVAGSGANVMGMLSYIT